MKTKGKTIISIATACFVLTLIASTALAATLYMQTINYQGRLAESGGVPVNGPVSMTFAIYNTSSGGAPLWTETQSNVTVTDGAFSVVLGSIYPIDLPFDEQYYLGVQVDTDAEMSPRALLLSVPYAMRAAEVNAPLELSEATSASVINAINTGTGVAGRFEINNTDNDQPALEAITNGSNYAIKGINTGSTWSGAGYFLINNATSTAPALLAQTYGPGRAGFFSGGSGVFVGGNLDVDGTISGNGSGLTGISYVHNHDADYVNVSGDSMTGALSVSSAVDAVYGNSTWGRAGRFEIDNAANANNALYATTLGTGNAGRFHIGNTSNTFEALYASTNGTGNAGRFQVNNTSSTDDALWVLTTGTGYSGRFEGGAGLFVLGDLTVGGYISPIVSESGHFRMTDESSNYSALSAITDGTGSAGHFQITNTSNTADALWVSTAGTGYSGYFSGGMGVFIDGVLVANGGKNFVQPHPTDPTKQIAYVSIEAPESAVMIRGKARLVDGRAVIETPEYFRLVAGLDEDITVQFTPRSLDSKGLAAYVVTKDRIEVGELLGGKGTYEFDYLITAKRAGFEGHEPIQPNTNFTADMKTAEEFEQAYAKDNITSTAMRKLLMSNGILTADGKLNMELAKELGWVVKDSDVAVK